MDREQGESKLKLLLGIVLLIGIFVLAIGTGLYFFGGVGAKPSGVRVISATNYDDFELKSDAVLGETVGGAVDINNSTQAQLEDLPGVGPVTAGKIIAGRPYESLEELLTRKAVGRSLYEKISSQLTLGE